MLLSINFRESSRYYGSRHPTTVSPHVRTKESCLGVMVMEMEMENDGDGDEDGDGDGDGDGGGNHSEQWNDRSVAQYLQRIASVALE